MIFKRIWHQYRHSKLETGERVCLTFRPKMKLKRAHTSALKKKCEKGFICLIMRWPVPKDHFFTQKRFYVARKIIRRKKIPSKNK